MSSKETRKSNSDDERTDTPELAANAQAGEEKETAPVTEQERSDRETSFTRRALLQWSIPVILAITLPVGAFAQASPHSDAGCVGLIHIDHTDAPAGHVDHCDGPA